MITFNKVTWYSKLSAVILFLLVFGIAFYFGAQFERLQNNNQLNNPMTSDGAKNPENATYTISGKPVTLVNGKANIEIVLGSVTQESVRLFGEPKYFDIDGDGVPDAIAFLETNSGGSGTFYYVVVALQKNGLYYGTNAMFIGDRIAPQSIDFIGGRAVVNYSDRRPGEPFSTQPSVGKSIYVHLDPKSMEIGELHTGFEGETLFPEF